MSTVKLARIGDLCQQDRITVRPGEGADLRYIGLEAIESGTGAFVSGDLSKTPEVPQANSFRFGPQHLLYGKLRPYLNKVAVPDFEGKCSTEIIPLRPSEELDRRYLSFFLRSATVVDQISKRAAGARMPRADMDFVLDLRIPLPTLDDQRRIVDLLSRAEGIVRLRYEARAKAAEIVPALFLDMFGDPATNPKRWPVATIGDFASYTRYGPRFHDRRYADNGAHILRTTDMGYAGELAWQQSPKLAVSAEELDRYTLRPGTLLVTRTGATIGKTALFRGAAQPCIAGAYLIELGLSERVVPDFVLHLLLGSYGQAQLSHGTRTVAQPNINVPAICAIRLPTPPLDMQRRFERHVRTVDTVLEQQRRAVEVAYKAFTALLSRTFNGHPAAIPLAAEGAAVA